MHDAVETWLQKFYEDAQGAGLPVSLLRSELQDAWQPSECWARNQLLGSRLCAAQIEGAGFFLLGHACGPAREIPALTVLSIDNEFQVGTESYPTGTSETYGDV